ncbi:MAG: SH3 domain-containing protein, partial [Anaerolineae bacterium]|nr:SH3 domain-containing protein [Anaerolineae bacterium]
YDYRAAYPDDEDLPPSYNPDAAFSAPPVTPPLYGAGAYDPAAPPRMARKRIEARRRRDSALYLPWWSLLLLLAAVAFFAAILILGMNLFGGQSSPEVETPLVIVVTSTPTRIATTPPPPTPTFDFTNVTPGGTPGAAGTAAVGADSTAAGGAGAGSGPGATEAAASALPPSATPLALSIGATVEVFDVDTSGLNVRDDVGLAAEVLFIASDGSQFEIIAGPEEANDFTWWQIRETGGATAREGWAVADFLRVVAAE